MRPKQRDSVRAGGHAHQIRVRHREHRDREDQRHRARIEETFNNVDRNLQTEREPCLFGHQIRANRIGNAADQSDGRKADNLGTEQRERRNVLVVLEKLRPAHAAKSVGKIDARRAGGDLDPVGLRQLCAKNAKVKVNSIAAPEDKCGQGGNGHQSQNQLAFLQAFSHLLRSI